MAPTLLVGIISYELFLRKRISCTAWRSLYLKSRLARRQKMKFIVVEKHSRDNDDVENLMASLVCSVFSALHYRTGALDMITNLKMEER